MPKTTLTLAAEGVGSGAAKVATADATPSATSPGARGGPALVKEPAVAVPPNDSALAAGADLRGEARQQLAGAALDAIRLLERAEALGLSHARGALIRARLRHPRVTMATVERIERRLRAWMAERRRLFR